MYRTVAFVLLAFTVLPSQTRGQAQDLVCDKCVQNSDIAQNAVVNSKIKDAAVDERTLKDGAVSGRTIANGAVAGSKIQDGAVGFSKLDSALQDLIGGSEPGPYFDGAAANAFLRTVEMNVSGSFGPFADWALSAKCPAGHVVTGGGVEEAINSQGMVLWQSSPQFPNTWTCRGANRTTEYMQITCTAVCLTMGGAQQSELSPGGTPLQ
jgi:hypothetical protein